jgi:PEP-CTERM motif
VKRTLIWVVAAFIPATALQASTVITCSESAMVTNTCTAAHITDFNANLQWSVLGPATGVPFTAPAIGSAGEYQVTVSAFGGQMILADNYGMISNGAGGWINPAVLPSAPFRFTGRFDAQPDSAAAGMPPVGSPGDSLVGTFQNNSSMLLAFSQAINGFAFRISSNSLMTFNVTISEYSSSDGTGTPLVTSTLTSLPGGNCPGLASVPPVPCNDAMWLVGMGFNNPVGSIVIHTSDTSGFYLDDFYGIEPVPEPGTMGLIGLGLMAGAYMARRRTSKA